MKLVVAEKPSVGRSIAAVLGAAARHNGYLEGNGYTVTWCIGHLVESAKPEAYGEQYAEWNLSNLPIIPEKWKYTVKKETAAQYKIVKELMSRSSINEVICATDAGREGELIFRSVYHNAGCKKPIKRLWISSMEEAAIAEGFRNLREGCEYEALYNAALCRDRADWLVGMNGSRLFSVLYRANIGVGRVMSPTLSMMVDRQRAIEMFVKEPYWVPEINCDGFIASGEKTKDKTLAERIAASCGGKAATVTALEKKEKVTAPPKLYDLTTLQREANRDRGYTADQTLKIVQSLYEKKIATYPRTDSRYLTSDMLAMTAALVRTFSLNVSCNISQVIDDGKVTDHHAIIPTKTAAGVDRESLPEEERVVLDMLIRRLLQAVGDKHEYAETVVELLCEGSKFKAKGKTVITPGWRTETDYQPLPSLTKGQAFTVTSSIREGFTSPPKPYTEDTLLAAMESAGAEDMPEDAERKGIGTSATRASIIEKLTYAKPNREPFVRREKKNLIPTQKGIDTISILPDSLKSPQMTAEWEEKLTRMARGELGAETFMADIAAFTRKLVETNRTAKDGVTIEGSRREGIGRCPSCSSDIVEGKANYYCSNRECKFVIWKEICKRAVTKAYAKKLLERGRTDMIEGFVGKSGKPFAARLVLKEDGVVGFEF
jgi:DNA topoisomerase-3